MRRKIIFASFLMIFLLLCSCKSGINVSQMKGWTFQYNQGTNDYSIFFGLCDKLENYTSADCTVDIEIVNDNGETVYSGTKEITSNDFGNYSNVIAGQRYLANVRIKEDEITPGSSSSGTVYFTVTGEYFAFEQANCSAYSCLPVSDIELTVDELPINLIQKGIMGSTEGKYTITDVSYSVNTSLGSPSMTIVISGEKTGGSSGSLSYDIIGFKLYDSEEYLVESGMITLGNGLSPGDKFKSDDNYIYDVTPGETYTLVLTDYEW